MRAAALSVVCLAACASSGRAPVPERETVRIIDTGGVVQMTTYHAEGWVTHELPSPPAAAWAVLRAVYDSVGIAPTVIDSSSQTIGNDGMRLRRRLGKVGLQRYLDCGSTQGGPNAENYEVYMSVRTQVLAASPSGSRVSTTVKAEAKPVSFPGDWVRCTSKNTLERAIAELAGRLAGQRP